MPRREIASSSREETPGPPLDASTAFMLAFASALLAALTAVAASGARVLRHAPRPTLDLFTQLPLRPLRLKLPPGPRHRPRAHSEKNLRRKQAVRRRFGVPRRERAGSAREETPRLPVEVGTAFMLASASALVTALTAVAAGGGRALRHAPRPVLDGFALPLRPVRLRIPRAPWHRWRLPSLNVPVSADATEAVRAADAAAVPSLADTIGEVHEARETPSGLFGVIVFAAALAAGLLLVALAGH
jgi:hypothetical protein